MDISLSDQQIRDILKENNIFPVIITYPDLQNYTSDKILEILKRRPIVLCYLTKKNYGHWTCMFIDSAGVINFFDPYGLKPDDELKWKFPATFKKLSHEDYAYLTELLYELCKMKNYKIEYNDADFQSHKSDITTCGRHCIVRLCFSNLSADKYTSLINELCHTTNKNPDQVVTSLTQI
jgi:hypothetical protein